MRGFSPDAVGDGGNGVGPGDPTYETAAANG
jgi:hypothetical protein